MLKKAKKLNGLYNDNLYSKRMEIKTLHGSEISPYLKDIARLRIQVFRDFPYLYEGSFEYEEKYLDRYAQGKGSLIAIVLDKNKVVGATSCLPASEEMEAITEALSLAGITTKLSWQDVDEKSETEKTLVFWTKSWNEKH
ncbi:hypothetical protein GW915_08395 [bacterium]|nr:hypothetical protein [bacterium]